MTLFYYKIILLRHTAKITERRCIICTAIILSYLTFSLDTYPICLLKCNVTSVVRMNRAITQQVSSSITVMLDLAFYLQRNMQRLEISRCLVEI